MIQGWKVIRSTHHSVIVSPITAAFGIVAVVAGQAGRGVQVLRMAVTAGGITVVHAAASFVRDARVGSGIGCIPVAGGMTGGAVLAKHPDMEGRIRMAAHTGSG